MIKYLPINILFLLVFFLENTNLYGQDLINLNDIPLPLSQYNDHSTFPERSVVHDYGNLQIIKAHDLLSFIFDVPPRTEPTQLDFIADGKLIFTGAVMFSLSEYEVECKKLSFQLTSKYLVVDDDTIDLDIAPFPQYLKDSLRVDLNAGVYSVIGQFDTVMFSNGLGSSTVRNIFLDECDGTENCKIDFNFNIAQDSIVDFENLSTIGSEADFFDWDFGDGNVSSFDDPSNTYDIEGIFSACLRIIDNGCVMGGKDTLCKNVEIIYSEPEIEETDFVNNDEHIILTPNDDGVGDFVNISSESIIYSRHGHLILKTTIDIEWTGVDAQENQLPTGLYTVLNNDGTTFHVTVVR